jgi:3D (Asp-Asp-Asp) domain-containing protein
MCFSKKTHKKWLKLAKSVKKKKKKYLKMAKISLKKRKLSEALEVRGFLFFLCILLLLPFVSFDGRGSKYSFPVAQEREPLKVITVVATAYSSDVGQTDESPCIPADGYDLCAHYEKFGEGNTIAANFLPLGAQVKIPELFGDRILVVHDRMNRRYGDYRIDIWLPTKDEAVKFGSKVIDLEYYGGSRWKIVKK